MKKTENGSAHIVIIVAIVAALVGALGVVFYQKVTQKNTANTTVESSKSAVKEKEKNLLTQDFSLSIGGRTLSMKYPEGWTVTTSVGSSDENPRRTIMSPDGKYGIQIALMTDGVGGTGCGAMTFISSKTTNIPNGMGRYVFEYTTKFTDSTSGMAGAIILPELIDKSALAVGREYCDSGIGLGVFHGDGTTSGASTDPFAGTIMVPYDSEGEVSEMTPEQQRVWVSTENYRLGVKSLLTLKG